MDPRFVKLAKQLVTSTQVSQDDRVLLITDVNVPHDMNAAVVEAARKKGGVMMTPILNDERLAALCQIGCTSRQLNPDAASRLVQYLAADVRIALRGFGNKMEMSQVPSEDSARHGKIIGGVTMDEGIENTRWVLTSWPTPAFAQLAGMSTTAFEDFFFGAVLVDYRAMTKAAQPLVKLMTRAKKVKIIGPDTKLSFSIEGIPAVACTGEKNIPDGDVYTAPVRDSMNGHIHYNTLTITKDGQPFSRVRFEVKKGKIIKATCDSGDEAALNEMLNTDEGARFFGEFALGINPAVTQVIGDTLFDEKVDGTLHLTPGRCYDDADNGNQSAVHWDIVFDQREQSGGGEIWFDDKLIRKNGIFVPRSLQGLNSSQAA